MVIFLGGLFSTILQRCTYTPVNDPSDADTWGPATSPNTRSPLRRGPRPQGWQRWGWKLARVEEARPGHLVCRRPESEASAGSRGSGQGLRILREKEKPLGTGAQGGRDYPSSDGAPVPPEDPGARSLSRPSPCSQNWTQAEKAAQVGLRGRGAQEGGSPPTSPPARVPGNRAQGAQPIAPPWHPQSRPRACPEGLCVSISSGKTPPSESDSVPMEVT